MVPAILARGGVYQTRHADTIKPGEEGVTTTKEAPLSIAAAGSPEKSVNPASAGV
jgi:hypothetical protein